MPFCPKCHYEYQPEVTNCPDCGRALVAELPPLSPPVRLEAIAESSEVVFEAPDAALSSAVKLALENAGIAVSEEIYGGPFRPQKFDLQLTGNYSRLMTTASQAEEARRIVERFLADYQSGALSLSEEEIAQAGPYELQPHHGLAVLVLGIVALALAWWYVGLIPGIIALVMANQDLAAMEAGAMDPAGRDYTRAGRLCAIVAIAIAAVLVLLVLVPLLATEVFLVSGLGR